MTLIPYIFGATINILMANYIYDLTINQGVFFMVGIELISCVSLLFSYRYGYLVMIDNIGMKKLRSPLEFLKIIEIGLRDLISFAMTIVSVNSSPF